MNTPNTKERRSTIRVPILSESCTWNSEYILAKTESSIANLSHVGMFIDSKTQPNVKDLVQVTLKLPGDMGDLNINGRVIRKRWAVTKKSKLSTGFAIKFESNNPKIEEVMKSYSIYMRNKQIIQVSTRIIQEFFGALPETEGPKSEK